MVVTCYTCHRGGNRPKVTPSLAALYGAAPPDEQDDVIEPAAAGAPSATQMLDKYIRAIGGPKAAGITSFAAKGTGRGVHRSREASREVFAKAPGQRATIVHAPDGNITTTFDGRSAWIAAPINERPVPVLALSGGDLDAARLDAQLSFPSASNRPLRGGGREGRPLSTIETSRLCRARPPARLPRRFSSTRNPACWCGSCGTPTRPSAAFRCRPTTRIIATWPA